MTRIRCALAAAALLSIGAAQGEAQESAGVVRFAGCWEAADGMPARVRLCMVPEDGGLRITTIPAQGAATESSLRFDGDRVPVKAEDCTGWESARLTADAERIIVKSEVTCGPEPVQQRETTFSITPSGLLLQATGSGLAVVASAQVRVFSPVESYAAVSPAIREAVLPHLVAAERARIAQRDRPLSARDLVELEALGVSAPLIDLMVAAAYPRSFVIDARLGSASAATAERGGNAATDENHDRSPMPGMMFLNGYPMLSMYDWQLLYSCARFNSFNCASMPYYGYSGFASGFGNRYATGYYGGFWPTMGYIPVVVRPAAPAAPDGGRAVRGRGYTQNGNSSGGTAQPRSTESPSSSRTGSSSGGASSSSGSSSSGGSARTAKPRPPGS
jgi:hypothetical protein